MGRRMLARARRVRPGRAASACAYRPQTRYAAGTREILECYFAGKPIRQEYLVVDKGVLAGVGAHSYSAGNATSGSEEAARFKR
jgi:formate dehydrogenase